MSEPDVPLAAEFEPPTREAWLTLVEKVLKGGDFEKRLVSRTADGLAIQPLYTRSDESEGGRLAAGRTGWFPGGWDMRQRHAETDPKARQRGHPGGPDGRRHLAAAADRGARPGGAQLRRRGARRRRSRACSSTPAPLRSTRARTRWMPPAACSRSGATAGINENDRRGAFNYDPLGVLARTGTLYYPPDRSCEIAAKLAADCRTMSHVTALLADGRPYHEAGASEAQELAAMLATLVAYLRACETAGLQAAHGAGPDRGRPGGGRRPVPDHRQAARRAPAGERASRRPAAPARAAEKMHLHGHHLGAHDGQARSVGEHAAHHGRLRRRGVRRRRRDHRAALHLGARQARRLRAAHRPQHAPGAAGGKRGRRA